MYKRLLAFGDSFTFGHELDDCFKDQPSNQTYSALLGQWLDIPYQCHAVGSNANQSITRNILNADILQNDLVIIMWTYEERQDFLFDGKRGWSSVSPTDFDQFATCFYKHIDPTLQYFQYLSHKEIFLVQKYLDNIGVNHIHCCVTSSLLESINYRNSPISKQINTSNWIAMPGPTGFYDWAKSQSLIVRQGGHANSYAHQQLFELIKQHMPG
jgi:hypothetical protein